MPTKKQRQQQETDTKALAPAFDPNKSEWTQAERQALMRRAEAGDKTVRAELRAMLAAHPESVRRLNRPPRAVAHALLRELTWGDAGLDASEPLAAYAEVLVRELEGENPTALERLLCERVVGYWMAAYLLDTTVATDTTTGAVYRMPPARAEFESRMKTQAAERFNNAALTLAKVRRLLSLPALQVNIAAPGSQQLNVASTAAPRLRTSEPPAPLPSTTDTPPVSACGTGSGSGLVNP